MEELNLPPFKFNPPQTKKLSMNDYLKFVYLNLKYTFNRDANRKREEKLKVKVPFLIK